VKSAPEYFETIRQSAKARWDQLEADPELAGPWHQLFNQVQSPRHVLSELLQNADDAGASEAAVRIDDGHFIFEHNGEDFTEEQFESLCRFAYSNKRSLHTIGFRGIGFKSTFSLGNCIRLSSPSLSVCFFSERFTLPDWVSEDGSTSDLTRIQVEIGNKNIATDIKKNIDEWLKNPVSLLFFKNVRRMRINDEEVHWGSMGPGPVANSEWMALNEDTEEEYLLIRSNEEPFPDDALQEVKNERSLSVDSEAEFPPCRVEIVLGAKGHLYVVLPTGVETQLPFACNAPFMQDPARLKIKDVEMSPTNRWLLDRIGSLAASAMLQWLHQTDSSTVERAPAYGLLPDVDRTKQSLEGQCGLAVEKAFERLIEGQHVLLAEDGSLRDVNRCIAIPRWISQVWPISKVSDLLDDHGRPPLCQHVESSDLKKLLSWRLVDKVDRSDILLKLQRTSFPKPETWQQLLTLWAYLEPDITGYRRQVHADDLRILPVQAQELLYAPTQAVRLGEKKLLHSQDDWKFLSSYLAVLNQNWLRYLTEQRRHSLENDDESLEEATAQADSVLATLGMDKPSHPGDLINRVSAEFFSRDVCIEECVRLAQIAAKLRAHIDHSLRYVTEDMKLRSMGSTLLFDSDGGLRELLSEPLRESQFLHSAYSESFQSCSQEEWMQWVMSEHSGIRTFVPLEKSKSFAGGRQDIEKKLRHREWEGSLESRYNNPDFYIEDWDFRKEDWDYWQSQEMVNPEIWCSVAERILLGPTSYWRDMGSARIIERASNGHENGVRSIKVIPLWVQRLRAKKCLRDTQRNLCKPGELLRRTTDTEPFLGVEPFVDDALDREATRSLLELLGVHSTPSGPDRLMDRLRALAGVEDPPVDEVEKWYRRLDQAVNSCSSKDFQAVQTAFQTEKLILSQNGTWEAVSGLFLMANEEDVPDAEVIRTSVGELTIWRKLGVSDRPTLERAIEWLNTLPHESALRPNELRRVKSLLSRYPDRVWNHCGRWLNLSAEWVSTENLAYSMSMQSLLPWKHLYASIKGATADLQGVQSEVAQSAPFSHLTPLATKIEERFREPPNRTDEELSADWLTAIGNELCRVELDEEHETQRARGLADRLANTQLCSVPMIEIMPFIDGKPAGTSRHTDVQWADGMLYVTEMSKGRQARRLPEEIAKVFAREDVKAALHYGFERDIEQIRQYISENFKLCPSSTVRPKFEEDPVQGDASVHKTPSKELSIAQSQNTDIPDIDDSDADQRWQDGEEEMRKVLRSQKKPARAALIDLFATLHGFRREGKDRYMHEDGSWIARTGGDRFPWERRSAEGALVRCYYPKNHCLENGPMRIDADVWDVMELHPDSYALVLLSSEKQPVEIAGADLRAMREAGTVKLHPAAYRLVYSERRK